ncbi:MAG: Type I restriction-modification system, specificity subunit S [Candidatus Rifleibacterium amylolyticum]|nr:MAG: Type I restriction-modification system, specificity subunit S [Candidatus Rifleibacterium amylolyticum]
MKKVKLRKYAIKIGSGMTPKGGESSYKAFGIPLIRSQNVLENKLSLENVAFIDAVQHKKMSGSKVNPGDVLLNITGASIGRSCVVPQEVVEANVNQHVCVIRLKRDYYAPFLSSFLNSWFGQKQVFSFQGGGSREGLNYQQIASFDIPSLQYSEQKAIADLLSTWDEAIEKTTRLIQAKEKTFKRLLNDLIYLPTKHGKWHQVRTKSLFKERRESNRGDLPLLSITSNEGVIPREDTNRKDTSNEDKSKYLRICPGDIGYNTMRMWQGVSALSFLEGIVSPAYTICIPGVKLHPQFVAFLFKTSFMIDRFYRYSQGLTSDTWNLKFPHFGEVKMPLPSISEQKFISETLSSAQTEIGLLRQLVEKYKNQKRGLMQKLLTGQWRVKPEIINRFKEQ